MVRCLLLALVMLAAVFGETAYADAVLDRVDGPVSGDNAPVIQKVIDDAFNRGGGTVFVSAGVYGLSSQVLVRPHVHLVCVDNGFDFGGSPAKAVSGGGTVFAVRWGAWQYASDSGAYSAAVVGQMNSSVENCGFYYPDQDSLATVPIEYGATILAGGPGFVAIHNFCANCYSFLDFRGSMTGGVLYNVRAEYNWGSPIAKGLRLNNIVDWSHWGHNVFHAGYYDFDDWNHLPGWSLYNGNAFEVGSADWVNLEDEQEVAYAIGVEIQFAGSVRQGPVDISRSKFDACRYACVAALGGGTIMNLRIVDSTLVAYDIKAQMQSNIQGGIAVSTDGWTTISALQFLGNHVFGPTNYALIITKVGDLIVKNNDIVSISSVAAQTAAFIFGSDTRNAIMRDNPIHGFRTPYWGAAVNLVNEGNFN